MADDYTIAITTTLTVTNTEAFNTYENGDEHDDDDDDGVIWSDTDGMVQHL